jgi:molecular chaperone GrpE
MSSKHHEPRAMQKDQSVVRPGETEKSGETTPTTLGSERPEAQKADLSEAAGTRASAEQETAARLVSMESEIASLRGELSVLNDKYLRKLADEVNFRKRMVREKEDTQRFAVSGLLGDLIPVLDDFDRAMASAETAKNYTVLHDGIVLTRRQLAQVLDNKYGLRRIESVGKAFDPNLHEAVAIEQPGQAGAAAPADEPVVAEEFLPGYGLHDRVLRTAKVKVRMPAPKQAKAESVDAEGAGTDGASGE